MMQTSANIPRLGDRVEIYVPIRTQRLVHMKLSRVHTAEPSSVVKREGCAQQAVPQPNPHRLGSRRVAACTPPYTCCALCSDVIG